jgi:hypothetical protein
MMVTRSEQAADETAANFLTDTDRLVFLMEEVTRRLRRTFDTSYDDCPAASVGSLRLKVVKSLNTHPFFRVS